MKKLLLLMLTSLVILLLMFNCDNREGIDIGEKPEARFTVSDSIITPGTKVQFTDSSTNSPTSWKWEFGDGNFGIDTNVSHTYNETGTYTVKLTVGNNVGFNTMTKEIIVGLPPVAYFKASNISILKNGTIQFSDTSDNTPTNWIWFFGDGNYSTAQNPSNQYSSDTGYYDVTLTVSNIFGSDTLKKENYIHVYQFHILPSDTIHYVPL